LRHRHVHRRQHALARRRVDGIGDHAHDLVAGRGQHAAWDRLLESQSIESQTDALSKRLHALQIPANERFVHDGHGLAAHAVAGLEVPAAPQADAHRLEPAWRRGVQPEGPAAGYRSVANADHAG
jgi:hypothetical protein